MIFQLKFARAVILCTFACAALNGSDLNAQSKKKTEKKPAKAAASPVAALVDGHKILISDVDRVIKQKPKYAGYLAVGEKSAAENSDQKEAAKRNAEMLKRIRESVLNNLIDRQLLIQVASKSKAVNEKELQEASEKVITTNGGEERLTKTLEGVGSSMAEFKRDLHDDLLVSNYLEKEIFKTVNADESEIRKVFDTDPQRFAKPETVHARHILIKVPKDAPPEADKAAKDKIDALHAQVTKKGADFAAIAKEKSECPSAPKGGDLGYFPRGAMVPEFEQSAFSLKSGQISGPIRTKFGYHVIKVEDRKAAGKPDFETARPEIQKEILTKKKVDKVQELVKNLKTKAKIEVKLPKVA